MAAPPLPTWTACWERAREPVDLPAAAAAAAAAGASLEALLAPHAAAVRLCNSPTAGRHLVAARRLPSLSLVMLDPAVLWYPASCDAMGATIPAMAELRQGLTAAAVDGILAQLAPFAGSGGGAALQAVPRHDLFMAACARNALGALVDEDAPPERRRLPMVCAAAAMLNHSCEPNCSYEGYFDAALGAPGIRVFCEEDVEEGEELTISYVPRNHAHAERADKLTTMYGFRCACPRCAAGVEDTIVFAGQRGACIPAGSTCSAEGAALLRQRAAWLQGNAGKPAALAGVCGAPAPLLAPGDQGLYSALYALLGGLWNLDPAANPQLRELQCAVGRAVCSSAAGGALGRRGRGRCFPSDALLITGHFHALAGRRSEASEYYATARHLYAALYGGEDYRVRLAGELAAAPPASKAAAEHAEGAKLGRTRNWVVRYGVSAGRLERWGRGAPVRSGPEDASAMRALLEASRAIMQKSGLLARVKL